MDDGPRTRSLSDPTSTFPPSSNFDPGPDRRSTSLPLQGDLDSALLVDKIGDYPAACGGYSDVWKANMITKDGHILLVAWKVLRLICSDPGRPGKRLTREVLCWKRLRHESIAPFYGVVYQSNGCPGLVSPWYANGCANIYLREHPDVDPLQVIWEIALGVEYLHDRGVIHGDLKGANVMIDDDGHAKLIDFGLSRIIDLETGLTTPTTSSARWSAPELLISDAPITKASDVYAFASTVLELLTGCVPYNTLGECVVPLTVINGMRPRTLSSGFRYDIPHSEKLWDLLEMCWAETAQRPNIREVKKRLSMFYS